MTDFDTTIARDGTHSSKWERYGDDILPLWVADMDFATPPFVLDAVRRRLEHPILGYTNTPPSLTEAYCEWAERRFGWSVSPEWLVWIPGVVPGINLTAMAVGNAGDGILVPAPVYHPFLYVARFTDREEHRVYGTPPGEDPSRGATGGLWRWPVTALEDAATANDRLLLLCNPQNPTGRVFDADELDAIGTFALERDIVICSDEIHCDLLLAPGASHTPIACRSDDVAHHTVTLHSPNKTYNIPGIGCAVAVIPDAQLRREFKRARKGLVHLIGPLSYAATEACYRDDTDWLPQLLEYLRGNYALVCDALGARVAPLEGTYLAWIDLTDWTENPAKELERWGVGLSEGVQFGLPGYARLNFATTRANLERGLARITRALTDCGLT